MNIIKRITHLPYRILKARRSGLAKLPRDDRDFKTENLGWGLGYTPKAVRKINKTLSIKNQHSLQTCQWNATTAAKEPDEGVELSVRSLVAKASKTGLCGSLGLSNLRDGQKLLNNWGIMEEEDIPEMYDEANTWNQYVNIQLDDTKAAKHKTKSYWSVSSIGDVYKLLDDGRCLTTGMAWFTGFNQGGGFRAPWIIRAIAGWAVGGHAVCVVGYDTQYNGCRCLILQNSYGREWGDSGLFYIEEKYFMNNVVGNYGCFVNLDIDKDAASVISSYDQQVVKGDKTNGVYKLEGGKKKPFVSWDAFYAHYPKNINDMKKLINIISQDIIDAIPTGDPMTVENSPYHEALANIKKPFDIIK